MTPGQLRAHNMLTHTLWPEWEVRCAAVARDYKRSRSQYKFGATAAREYYSHRAEEAWSDAVCRAFCGSFMIRFDGKGGCTLDNGEHYAWIDMEGTK